MALKRKYADRRDWKRITERRYAQVFMESESFTGYIALLSIQQVTAPLYVPAAGRSLCVADSGYEWLHHIPTHGAHAVTTMFNASGHVVQWYIDICLRMDVDERQIPWFDDLFLDIVLLPSGEVELLDADELEEALRAGMVSSAEYQQAWDEAGRLMSAIRQGEFDLPRLAEHHRSLLHPR